MEKGLADCPILFHTYDLLRTLQFYCTQIFPRTYSFLKKKLGETVHNKNYCSEAPCVGWLSDHIG